MQILAYLAAALGLAYSPTPLEIAQRVASASPPDCRSYYPDGSEGPCLASFGIDRGRAVNARARGGHITFTQGAVTRLTPDEFALLAGHELAHWYLGHRESSKASELAADILGAQLACRAGYDPITGASLFRYVNSGRNYPAPQARRQAVQTHGCGGVQRGQRSSAGPV